MNRRIRNTAMMLALGTALVLVGLYLLSLFQKTAEADVRNGVPSDAQVLLVLHYDKVRQSPYRVLFSDGVMPPMLPSADQCGKNLLERVSTLALWVPAGSDESFGMVALAPVSPDALWTCAKSAIEQRDGTPSFNEVEGFRIISDESLSPGSAQIAIRKDGLLVVARPATRSRMMDALAGRIPSATTEPHQGMLERLGVSSDLTLSMTVSPQLQARIDQWVGEPTALLEGVTSLAASVDMRPQSEVHIVMNCATKEACWAAHQRYEVMLRRAIRSLPLRALGLSALLENARMEKQETELWIHMRADSQQVIDIIQRMDAPVAPTQHHSAPNEILKPKGPEKTP